MSELDPKNSIGSTLQKYRLLNHLTQNDVADITDLEPRHISQIERGYSKGSIDTIIKFCNAYHITPDIVLSDLLNKDVTKDLSDFNTKFNKLSIEDKNTIMHLIDYYIDRDKL